MIFGLRLRQIPLWDYVTSQSLTTRGITSTSTHPDLQVSLFHRTRSQTPVIQPRPGTRSSLKIGRTNTAKAKPVNGCHALTSANNLPVILLGDNLGCILTLAGKLSYLFHLCGTDHHGKSWSRLRTTFRQHHGAC